MRLAARAGLLDIAFVLNTGGRSWRGRMRTVDRPHTGALVITRPPTVRPATIVGSDAELREVLCALSVEEYMKGSLETLTTTRGETYSTMKLLKYLVTGLGGHLP